MHLGRHSQKPPLSPEDNEEPGRTDTWESGSLSGPALRLKEFRGWVTNVSASYHVHASGSR